jgi:hypothetical protein
MTFSLRFSPFCFPFLVFLLPTATLACSCTEAAPDPEKAFRQADVIVAVKVPETRSLRPQQAESSLVDFQLTHVWKAGLWAAVLRPGAYIPVSQRPGNPCEYLVRSDGETLLYLYRAPIKRLEFTAANRCTRKNLHESDPAYPERLRWLEQTTGNAARPPIPRR